MPLTTQRLRRELEERGGLVNQAALASRWGVSPQRVGQLMAAKDFPEPLAQVGRTALYLADECDAWRAGRPKGAWWESR